MIVLIRELMAEVYMPVFKTRASGVDYRCKIQYLMKVVL
jgi:hypothetical protein